ncbi:MAG: allantoicase [Alphaproteobacteria bacterium]|jgi:allantoicase
MTDAANILHAEREVPDFAARYPNLANPRLGAEVISVTDEFFAERSRLIKPEEAVFHPDLYDDHGKWMDGWESRRRRSGGNDHALIKLGGPTVVRAINIDTAFFTGNFPHAARVLGAYHEGEGEPAPTRYRTLVDMAKLGPDAPHWFEVSHAEPVTHLRLDMYPDGGIARLRVHGIPVSEPTTEETGVRELSSILKGGRVLAFNDSHYGNPEVLLYPDKGLNMGDGWETRRRREPGFDWIIIALGEAGVLDHMIVDTAHYKGNFPASCSMNGRLLSGADIALLDNPDALKADSQFWPELLPSQLLSADAEHRFDATALNAGEPINVVRFNIVPDGGVSRLRLFGRTTPLA